MLAPFDCDNVRAILSDNLPWSPHDFVRLPAFLAADRAIYAESLTRNLDEQNDLRFIAQAGDGKRIALFAERLPWDSDFFGFETARLNGVFLLDPPFDQYDADYVDALRHLVSEARNRGFRYFFAPVDSRDLPLLRALGQIGFSLIETRCHYHRSLTDFEHPERYACRLATPEDVESLGRSAQVMADRYDRFHADPFIRPEDADRMMYRWIEASLRESFADATVVPDVPNPTAFCTIKYHRENWQRWGVCLGQPVFSAVSPEFKGWYLKIISECNYHLKDMGAEHAYLITQIANRAVIRTWEKLGFSLGKGEHILRLIL